MRHGELDTVRLPPKKRAQPARWRAGAIVLVAAGAAGGLAALVETLPQPAATVAAPKPVVAAVAPPAAPGVVRTDQPRLVSDAVPAARPAPDPVATEAEILASAPATLQVRRFALQPEIVVVQFASLADQARMLNRVAAFVERAGFPRDRVLTGADLADRLRARGEQADTLYYGHDYRAGDVLRFLDAAAAAGEAFSPDEQRLSALVRSWGWREGSPGALISLVRETPSAGLDLAARATILRHELSHGMYFVNAAYAGYVRAFWASTLTPAERARFRSFLASEGYDTAIDDLMMNEMQAYLMHTADARFFKASAIGIAEPRLELLRGLFLTGMPASWLRDCTSVPPRTP